MENKKQNIIILYMIKEKKRNFNELIDKRIIENCTNNKK